MTRRDFLRTSTAASTALLGASSLLAAAPAIPAIDTHIHLYDPSRPAGVPWPPKTEPILYKPHLPADFRPLAAAAHVVGAVVVEASEWVEDNAWLLDLARNETAIVGVVGQLRPGRPAFATDLRRFTANPLFRGLRLRTSDVNGISQPATAADLRRVADAGLAIDVLGGAAVLAPAVALARTFPSLPVVIDHLPFKDWDGNVGALHTAVAASAAQRNIVIKISEVARLRGGELVTDPAFYQPALDALLERFGPERVMFGSNWPVSNRVAPYASIHGLVARYFSAQPRAVAEAYFWRTSLATYRWQKRGAAAALGT